VSSRSRIVITGVGMVTPFGGDREASWRGLRQGQSAVRWLEAPRQPGEQFLTGDSGFPAFRAGAPVPALHPVESRDAADLDPVISYALRAAREALHDSGLSLPHDRSRVGCVVGTSKGGFTTFARALAAYRQQKDAELPEDFWLQTMPNAPAAWVARELNLQGAALCPMAACATGLLSVVRGASLIADGHCDVVLAGSSDASLQPALLASYRRLGVLAEGFDDPAEACRPFDRRRNGFLVGEGAAILVLEREEQALARGARPYAEWLSAGASADLAGMARVESPPVGLPRLVTDLLRRANVAPDEIDYVNLHGTATRDNDRTETLALKAALGGSARRASCSSLKGTIGHLLGAAGSVELAATVLAMRENVIPPTANLREPDAECDLDYTPLVPRARRIETALKLSHGFGGHLVAAVLRTC